MTDNQLEQIKLAAVGKAEMTMEADERGFFECDSEECAFNDAGICKYAAVYGDAPTMTEEDGCLSGVFGI